MDLTAEKKRFLIYNRNRKRYKVVSYNTYLCIRKDIGLLKEWQVMPFEESYLAKLEKNKYCEIHDILLEFV